MFSSVLGAIESWILLRDGCQTQTQKVFFCSISLMEYDGVSWCIEIMEEVDLLIFKLWLLLSLPVIYYSSGQTNLKPVQYSGIGLKLGQARGNVEYGLLWQIQTP